MSDGSSAAGPRGLGDFVSVAVILLVGSCSKPYTCGRCRSLWLPQVFVGAAAMAARGCAWKHEDLRNTEV